MGKLFHGLPNTIIESKIQNKMYKKIIILTAIVVGLLTMAFLQVEDRGEHVKSSMEEKLKGYEPIVVLELFTSQGCSSCPPADVLLEKAKLDFPEQVFALSYHVDYWNYIGWEDPFSKSAYTIKQRAYNKKFNSRSNYTPQMVVNGEEHFVGSNRSKLSAKISEYGKKVVENQISVTKLTQKENTIFFDYEVVGDLDSRTLRTVLVLDEETTVVKRGENRNRTLTNSNIVIAENYLLPSKNKGSGMISIPNSFLKNKNLTLLLLIEKDDLGISAAAKAKI